MRAVRVIAGETGGQVRVEEVDAPTIAPGKVLVAVKASGVNRGEILAMRAKRSGEGVGAGIEFAGVVEAVGEGVSDWRSGDRVMGHGPGGHAETILTSPGSLMRCPERLTWTEAAAFPNVFITAHDALVTNAEFAAGESVLVNAASSGIGVAAIQIASALGASVVIGVSRGAGKLAALEKFGMTDGINSFVVDLADTVKLATAGRGVDIIIDSVGGSVLGDNMRALAVQGRLVGVGRLGGPNAEIDLDLLALNRLKLIGVTFRTRSEAERLACIAACARDLLPLLAAGRISPCVDRVFPMSGVADAYAYMETNSHIGKIVLETAA